jgi:1,4-alpha-glucan branching enzyme
MHAGVQRLLSDLNHLYRSIPALHELDCELEGFAWIDCHDTEQSVISYVRRGKDRNQFVVIVCNFTPVVRRNYRIGVSRGGYYRERVNTDSEAYGGSGLGNLGGRVAEAVACHDQPFSLALTLPPLAEASYGRGRANTGLHTKTVGFAPSERIRTKAPRSMYISSVNESC